MTSREAPAVPMHRIAIASFAGTTIEFYDFFIYGTAAALVFGPVFFPALGAAAGTVAAFATFGVAFFSARSARFSSVISVTGSGASARLSPPCC